jgi:serine/threonine protein kinase
LILHGEYFKKCCEYCGEKYNNSFEIENKWCKSCQYHKNREINDFIRDLQLKVNHDSGNSGTLFELIPYDQFSSIKKIGEGGFSTVYSAIWKNGPLRYNFNKNKLWKKGPSHYSFSKNKWWMRESNKMVALKCIHDPQISIDEILNEVC